MNPIPRRRHAAWWLLCAHPLSAFLYSRPPCASPPTAPPRARRHPLALLDSPAAFQALTRYRDHGAFRLTAIAPGEALLTVSGVDGTPRLAVCFDCAAVLTTAVLA